MIDPMISTRQLMIVLMISPWQFMIDPLIFSWAINDCSNHFSARQLMIDPMIPQVINDCPNDFPLAIYD